MVKILGPIHSLGAHGALGAISFVRRRGVNVAEKKPVPADARSVNQLSWRHMYSKCAGLWHSLSQAEQAVWNSDASKKHMTGFAYWQSQCLRPNPGIYLPLQGGTMSGDIDMAKYRILKLPAPTDSQEAARKAEVDAVAGEHSLMSWRRLSRWHFSFPQSTSDAVGIAANNLWAVPFYSPFATTVTDIGLQCTTGVAGAGRLGIYLDNGSIYPGALVSDCGTIDVTAGGSKSVTALSIPLLANTLYWLVYVQNSGASHRAHNLASLWGLLGGGGPSPSDQKGTWRVAFVYAPLPDPFPAGAVVNTGNRPAIGVVLT